MSEYSQKSTKITNIYQLSDETNIVDKLSQHSHWRKPVLIIPALASEFTHSENRPVFENILTELRGATYLSDIILGLDAATEKDVVLLQEIIADAGFGVGDLVWGQTFTINQQGGSICEIKDAGSSPRLTFSHKRRARREADMGVLLTGWISNDWKVNLVTRVSRGSDL